MPKKTEVTKDLPEPAETSDRLEIPFRDGVVTVPRERGKWPTRAVLALQRGANLQAVELVLGPVQWDVVTDSEINEFDEFCNAFADIALAEVFSN